MLYLVAFAKTNTGFCAHALHLPIVLVAGNTLAETRSLISEGIEFHLEWLIQEGAPIPTQPLYEVVKVGRSATAYIVAFEATDTGFLAHSPQVPGVGVAGTTLDETRDLIRDGIAFHFEGFDEHDLSIPEQPHLELLDIKTPSSNDSN